MSRPRTSGRIRRIALATAAVLLSAVLGEVAVRRLLPTGMVVEADIYRMDDGLLALRPGITRRHVTPLWDVTLRTNDDGFRDFDRGTSPGEGVVLGLGDSLAFGWGVQLKSSFYSRLEVGHGPRVRVIKAAVPGTGTSDQARLLERLLTLYRPRAVVLAFFVGNDFIDVARGGSAQYEVIDGFLMHRRTGEESSTDFRRWAIRSRLLQFLRVAQFRLGLAPEQTRHWDAWMREYAQVHLKNPPPETEQAFQTTLAALDDIAAQCRRTGARFLLVALPRSFQCDPEEAAEMARGFGWTPEDLDLDRPQRILAGWARAQGIPFVDLLPAFRQHTQLDGIPLFYTPDAHMTSEGHIQAAMAIAPAFVDVTQE